MKINVHVKDKIFNIECGEGTQKIRWLGDVGIFRYEHFHSKLNVLPKAIKFESGTYLNMNDKINEKLQEGNHVWVVFKEECDSDDSENEQFNKITSLRISKDSPLERPNFNSKDGFRIRPLTSVPRSKNNN